MRKTKKLFLDKHKKKPTARINRFSKRGNEIRFVRLDRLPNNVYNNYVKIIIDMKKTENVPINGYWTPKLIDTLRKEQNTFVILEGNKLLGIVFFQNMTRMFRNNMMGKLGNEFKSKADVDSYYFYYSVLHNYRYNDIINRKMFDKLFNMFISMNSLQNRNFVIILLQYLELQIHNLDIISKYKPFVDYMLNGVGKIKKLGFEYNGYHINLNNEIINVFMKRHLNSSATDANNYYPTYIITRQLDNYNASKVVNLEYLVNKEGLYPIKNVYKYCINNRLIYYTNFIDNEIFSIYRSTPYEFNFMMNYITNELGNNHIICNYPFLYNALIDYYGANSRDIQNFAKIIDNLDDVYNLLDNKNIVMIRNFNMNSDNIVLNKAYNDKEKFREYCNNYKNQLLYGYYIIDMTYVNNQIQIKDNNNYLISKTIVFTYINKELKLYIGNTGGIQIYNFQFNDNFTDKELDSNSKFMIFPDDYKYLVKEPISDKEINILTDLITENCKIIGKMYKKHVANDINQINGFRSVHIYMRPIKVNGEYKIIIHNTAYFNKLSNRHNYEHSDWLNEIAIKPALYKGYKTNNHEPHYQPIDID